MTLKDIYRVADYITDFLADHGVGHVFLLPGGGAMHLVDAAGKSSRLKAIACLHEQAAAISAEAYARINERLGVVMVTTGPGATNAITPVAGAWIESVPLMVISGQVKRSDLLGEAPLRQKGVQEVDIVRLVKSITKYAVTVQNPADIPGILEEALFQATDGRAGPVWIDVPLDVQGAPFSPPPTPLAQDSQKESALSSEAFERIRKHITHAKRPLIFAGHGVRLSGAARAFSQWVESLGIPVVTTWNALDLLPDAHPLNVGRPGVVALRAPNFAIQNCDFLLSIGCRLDNILTAYNPRGFAPDALKIVVDVDAHEIAKLEMDIAETVVSDAHDFILALQEKPLPPNPAWPDWVARCQDWKRRYPLNDGRPLPTHGPISHVQLMDALSEAIPPHTLVSTGSSGLAVEAFYTIFRNKPGQRVFLTSGLGAMGYGLPAAIGACFANGQQPMVCVESDGSLQLNIQELATLRAFDLPICLIVMNNGGYASIRNTQRNYFSGRYVGTGPEAGLFFPPLEMLARAYELGYHRVASVERLAGALKEALADTGPRILEVCLIPDESLSPKVAAIPQPDGGMLSMPLEDMSPLLPLETLEREMGGRIHPASKRARHVD